MDRVTLSCINTRSIAIDKKEDRVILSTLNENCLFLAARDSPYIATQALRVLKLCQTFGTVRVLVRPSPTPTRCFVYARLYGVVPQK